MLFLPHHEDSKEWNFLCFTFLKTFGKRLCNVMIYFVNAQTATLVLTDLEDKFHNYIISILKGIKVSILNYTYKFYISGSYWSQRHKTEQFSILCFLTSF